MKVKHYNITKIWYTINITMKENTVKCWYHV